MDGKTVIILILAIALSGVLGYLFSQRRMRKMMMKKKRGGMKKKGGMKKRWANKIKPEGAAKGEPAESQSGVAQYAIENGL